MFKPGETAGVRGEERTVTIVSGLGPKPGTVETSDGVFDEADLFVAHPSVLHTASGRDLRAESFRAHLKESEGKLSWEIREQLEKVFKKTAFDWNGHWKDGADIRKEFKDKLLKDVILSSNAMDIVDAEELIRSGKKGLGRWVPVSLYLSGLRDCSCCGEDVSGLETTGLVLRLAGDRCKYPDGLPLTEWELNVPSGRLAVANDLRGLFPLAEDESFDINTLWGCRGTVLAYAASGMSHAFVGNTCPGVYRCSDGTIKIASPPSDERWDEKTQKYVAIKPEPKFDGEQLASICTDLWWYSICDHEEFLLRCKKFKRNPKNFRVEVIDVPPGVYRFRHNEAANHRDSHDSGECVYTRFEKVREPDPVKDFLADYESVDVNAHAYVQAMTQRWPTLYGRTKNRRDQPVPWADLSKADRHAAWQRVADHIFCTIGSGTDWHAKGFPSAKVDSSVPDVEPPSFRVQHHWYPFSEPYGGLFEPKVLAPSFAKLAFRVLESVISFGTDVQDGERSREVPYVRQRMLLAVNRYRQLAEKYPDFADPEYVRWLGEDGRAEAWVAGFDLGPEFTEKHRKHAEKQRWVPEDAYAIEFDARKLKDGNFAWHPNNGGCGANKKDAERYALLEWRDNKQPEPHNCFWASNTRNTSVPLYVVARVKKVGEVSHMGDTLVELAFDYGTAWMRGSSRKAVSEAKEKAAIRILSKKEYEQSLPEARQFFIDSEAKAKRAAKSKS